MQKRMYCSKTFFSVDPEKEARIVLESTQNQRRTRIQFVPTNLELTESNLSFVQKNASALTIKKNNFAKATQDKFEKLSENFELESNFDAKLLTPSANSEEQANCVINKDSASFVEGLGDGTNHTSDECSSSQGLDYFFNPSAGHAENNVEKSNPSSYHTQPSGILAIVCLDVNLINLSALTLL